MFAVTEETTSYDANDYAHSDSALVRKYARSAPFSAKITCEFTTDSAMLYQYARLRDAAENPWGVNESVAPKNNMADNAQVIIARNGLLCVGGASLAVTNKDAPAMMPMEIGALRLSTIFPQLDLAEASYAEIFDVVVSADKGESVMQQLLAGLIKLSVAEDVEYIFYVASQPQARVMQRAMNSLDVNCDIRSDIALPEAADSDGIKRVLSIMDVSKYAHSLRAKKREKLLLEETA